MSSTKGSGAARSLPKRRSPQGKKNAASESLGRKTAASNKVKMPTPSDGGKPVDAAASGAKHPPFVVCSSSSHPECEPGTFDATALLRSVLAVVEPRLEEGFRSLQQSLSVPKETAAGTAVSQEPDLRAVGRQIGEALRAGVVEGMRARERHLAQLVLIDRAAAQAKVLLRLQERIGAEIEKAGIRRVVDLEDLSLFNSADGVTGTDEKAGADVFELVTPAYVDADSGRVIERGWVRQAPSLGAALPQGKTHGRTSRKHKYKEDESGSELHQSDHGVDRFPRVADDSNASETCVELEQQSVKEGEETSGEMPAHTAPASERGCSDSWSTVPREACNGQDAGGVTPAYADARSEIVPGRKGCSAPLIPASFWIRRLLGDHAEEGESQRRNS
ncbi:hypothetical protein [Streptomyces rochei]|uniref:hypothetical protein n=1 Tax=Streptomyces rochei TaxID=1928 RepID=UPI0035308BDF